MHRCLFIICIYLLSVTSAFAYARKDSTKKEIKYKNISVKYQAGRVLQTNDFLKGDNLANTPITFYQSWAITYSRQTSGLKEWEHVHNFPHYGFGFYTADFHNDEELGLPNAIYGFIGLPIRRWSNSVLGYKLGFGLTYNWKPYDGYKNPFNVAIGSYRTVYVDLNINYTYFIGKRWDLIGGFGFTHFSNGATRKPNKGINLISPYIELKYNLKDRPLLIREVVPAYPTHQEVTLNLAWGRRQLNPQGYEDKRLDDYIYDVYNFSVAYLKQPTWKNKYGIGIDLTYDESIDPHLIINEDDKVELVLPSKLTKKMTVGVYGTYEFAIDRLSIVTCMGVTALRKKYDGMASLLYQKFGAKYHLKNDAYFGILVRANNFSVAQFIEWNVGYRIKWQ